MHSIWNTAELKKWYRGCEPYTCMHSMLVSSMHLAASSPYACGVGRQLENGKWRCVFSSGYLHLMLQSRRNAFRVSCRQSDCPRKHIKPHTEVHHSLGRRLQGHDDLSTSTEKLDETNITTTTSSPKNLNSFAQWAWVAFCKHCKSIAARNSIAQISPYIVDFLNDWFLVMWFKCAFPTTCL